MWNIPGGHVERLRIGFPQHRFIRAADDREGATLIADAEIAFSAQVYPEQLASAARLRWIHSPAAGVGGMLYPDMLRRAIVLTNSRGLAADTIAEHTIGVTLVMFRRLHVAVRRQAERQWAQDEITRSRANRTISGARVLIVGLGAIGSAVAGRFTALGAHVTGIRRRPRSDTPPGVSEIAGPERLRDLLSSSDVVVIAAPHTGNTHHLIGMPELGAMKQDALLVNVSRGKLVDEDALLDALRSGGIGGAALDVFEHEPLSPDSALWTLPNVLITPHTSGFRPDHWDAATALFAENLRRFESGQPLLNVVDKEAGY
jgi:phosphoglycerate dehydrogenase-like enzyme